MVAVFIIGLYMASGFHALFRKTFLTLKFKISTYILSGKKQSEEYFVEYATPCLKEEK